MKIAIVSDIHANRAALAAVLAEIREAGPDETWCAGDIVGKGPEPDESVALLETTGVIAIAGNRDREAVDAGEGAEETRRWLAALPLRHEAEVEGRRVLMVHGSPKGIRDYVYPCVTEASLDSLFPAGADRPDVLVCGHSHLPFARRVGGTLVVNAGSVGRPYDRDPRTAWVLLTIDREGERAEIRRVTYPLEETLEAMERKGVRPEKIEAVRRSVRKWPVD